MTLRLFSRKLLAFTALAALPGTLLPEPTLAACTPSAGNGVTTVCTGTQTSPVGNGKVNDASVEVRSNALVSTGNQSAISLYDRAAIVVRDGGIVENNATGGGGGFFGTGPNTIEFNSGGTLTVEDGAIVRAKGTITNGEAVNVHGSGNTVLNRGLIQSQSGASIWFEDQSSGADNVVDNYGTVRALNGGSVIGNSGSGPVRFTNRTGATVEGSLSFANGDDTLDLEAGSVITGNFNGGGGRNSLLLEGGAGSSDTLVGNINNFQLLTKEGQGRWTLSGSVGNNGGGTAITILVDEGTLALTGDNSGFNGTATVDTDGVLEARAQSLMSAVTDNGLVRFKQSDNGTYSGLISGTGAVEKTGTGTTTLTPSGAGNTYTGGTTINGGAIAITRDAALGSTSGELTLNGGTLQFNASANIAASRAIVVQSLGGTINTNGNTTTVSQAISGTGRLVKAGAGTLTLTGANTYSGGTTISGGNLQIGNGGTTGRILGDVVDNGALTFNRSNQVTATGLISGSGGITQTGSGNTILSADNTYDGATNVNAGGLYINGDQSAGTGTTTVRNGATLGGFGTVGGDVSVSNGGHLAPGGLGTAAGTFNVHGDLSLAAGAILDYNLGEADAVAGELNDDTVVKGDLTLDGTINVETTPGGTFGAGVYRIIDYGGSLTNNGLEIGTIPSPNFFVQTSIDNQVNLINTEGLLLNYWDGAAGPKNDSSIQGGNGVWQNSSGNDNWTDFEGTPNAPFDNGAFAIFSADPGVVTIDNSLGGVQVSGMQFASDGYRINGNALTLSGTNVIVRVGDGTLAGRNFEATLDTTVSGTAHLEKTDLGTLILSQQNDYSGGTKITRGTLQLGNGAASGSIVGNVENNGTLAFNRANSGTFTGVISGTGRVTQIGAGMTTLLGTNTYSGGTTITNGTLRLGNGGTGGSITGDVRNDGTFAFNRSNTLTFGGVISGAGDVTQTGAGTTILTGDSLYSGGTTITRGVLQLGNGGTSGSIIGDIENNADLVLNRSNDLSLRGLISGTGNLTQAGGGDTTLTGDNTYAGTTTVNAGGLFIDGDQSGATGVTTVNNGAIIGGRGTIGGDVVIADGGTLMPGDRGDFAGTLTINGDLALADGATLEYQFGEADAAGGGFNDLTNVTGDLVLDGTLNVSTTPGGTFDPGIYRVINYSGTLTDNGLDIGTIPTPDFFVQTSIDKQVNLINESGLQLNYWDGGPGPKNDGVIAGGDGTWQNFTGNDNWTEFSGSINAPFEDSAFAVFTAAPGTVTVDGSLGDVRVSGMQFASDGYLITGDDVTLTGTRAKIRVGDSTTAGAGYTAEIASELTGTANLVKTDAGTLVLSGTNTYTGGTTVLGGVIEVSQDTNLGDAAGGLTLGFGTLHTTASFSSARDVNVTVRGVLDTDAGTTLTLDGDISGAGRLIKDGDGQLTLTGAATHGLGTVISAGTLQLGNGGTSGSLAGNVTNNGSLVFNRSNTLGLAGNISGSGDVEQAGTGRTVLVGSNTYTGGTTITGGTLQLGNGGTSGSIVGDVTDNGTLAFARSDTVTFGGIISGTGTVEQIGAGKTVLTAANTYTGGTSIKAGTLQLGNGGTSGSIVGDVADDGTLAFNRSDAITFGGTISGTGEVEQIGSGRTVLTGTNTYTGGTAIADGVLQLGNGGTSGSIVGDIANDSSLVFNRSNALMLEGVISGSGSVTKNGAGNTTLRGDNSYDGATVVNSGGLYIDGDQSQANGATLVRSGATLGGSATIGGNVTIADGAHLSPGDVTGAPGTLTINKNLTLGSGSVLDYNFGAANVVGGPLNDHTIVGGHLVLDGTLNVTTTPGGSFDPGVYRVFSYDGRLENHGLEIGTIPSPEFYVQTSITNQVNLVNTAGLVLNYWDGVAGPKNNGAINGGDGIWQNSAGNDNWTEATGVVNAPFDDGSFAIFTGEDGTVTVDDSLGAVTVSGMQFATDGYQITGDEIMLTGATSTIRVGDGTSGGAEFTASVASELAGASRLVKSDLGTLVLSGANTYSGGTLIGNGALQVSDDGNLGIASSDVTIDDGTLWTTADMASARDIETVGKAAIRNDASTTLTLSGTIFGVGDLTKTGGGTLLLSSADTHSGETIVSAGTLMAGAANVFSSGSATSVAANGTVDLNGFDQTLSTLENAGTVRTGNAPGTVLTTGSYIGKSGRIEISTVLGDDTSVTDQLYVAGDTSGSSTLKVTNVGGTGGKTQEGIKVVDVDGTSAGSFVLDGDYAFRGNQLIVAGAYGYGLFKNGVTATSDGDWYLRSLHFQPAVPIYEAYAQSLLALNGLPSLRERVGNRYWSGAGNGVSQGDGPGTIEASPQPENNAFVEGGAFWTRVDAGHMSIDPSTTTSGAAYDYDTWRWQGGADGQLYESDAGMLIGGLTAHYGSVSTDIDSFFGNGSIDSKGYGFGGTLTWYGQNGVYVDGQAQFTWYDSDLQSGLLGKLGENQNGFGYALSVESGVRIDLDQNWTLTPQAQLAYSSVDFDDFTDPFGARVALDSGDSLIGRLGLSIDHENAWLASNGMTQRSHIYGLANLYYEFLDGTQVDVSSTKVRGAGQRLWGGVGVGGSYNWDDDKYSVYGEMSVDTSLSDFADSYSVNGTIGLRVKF